MIDELLAVQAVERDGVRSQRRKDLRGIALGAEPETGDGVLYLGRVNGVEVVRAWVAVGAEERDSRKATGSTTLGGESEGQYIVKRHKRVHRHQRCSPERGEQDLARRAQRQRWR